MTAGSPENGNRTRGVSIPIVTQEAEFDGRVPTIPRTGGWADIRTFESPYRGSMWTCKKYIYSHIYKRLFEKREL